MSFLVLGQKEWVGSYALILLRFGYPVMGYMFAWMVENGMYRLA